MKPYALAVKAVIINEQNETLLLRRSSKNTSFVGCWEWPGGKVDPGEDFAVAVVREMKEESDLDIEITALAGAVEFEMPKVHVVLLCMEARITGGEIALSDEHDDWEWLPLTELKTRQLVPRVEEFMYAYARRKADGR